MDFQNLSDVHTGWNAEWVQHDIDRCAIRQIRHILDRQDLGDNALVAVTAGHFITFRNLTFLNDIDFNDFIDSRRQIVPFIALENAD